MSSSESELLLHFLTRNGFHTAFLQHDSSSRSTRSSCLAGWHAGRAPMQRVITHTLTSSALERGHDDTAVCRPARLTFSRRHSHCARAAWAQGRQYDSHDHTRSSRGRNGRLQPAGSTVRVGTRNPKKPSHWNSRRTGCRGRMLLPRASIRLGLWGAARLFASCCKNTTQRKDCQNVMRLATLCAGSCRAVGVLVGKAGLRPGYGCSRRCGKRILKKVVVDNLGATRRGQQTWRAGPPARIAVHLQKECP